MKNRKAHTQTQTQAHIHRHTHDTTLKWMHLLCKSVYLPRVRGQKRWLRIYLVFFCMCKLLTKYFLVCQLIVNKLVLFTILFNWCCVFNVFFFFLNCFNSLVFCHRLWKVLLGHKLFIMLSLMFAKLSVLMSLTKARRTRPVSFRLFWPNVLLRFMFCALNPCAPCFGCQIRVNETIDSTILIFYSIYSILYRSNHPKNLVFLYTYFDPQYHIIFSILTTIENPSTNLLLFRILSSALIKPRGNT